MENNSTIKKARQQNIFWDKVDQYAWLAISEILTPTERLIYDRLLYAQLKYAVVHVSQIAIADSLGISRRYVNKIIAKFQMLGLLRTMYRPYMTSIYLIPTIFMDCSFRTKMVPFFSACKYLPLALFSLLIYKDINNYLDSYSKRESLTLQECTFGLGDGYSIQKQENSRRFGLGGPAPHQNNTRNVSKTPQGERKYTGESYDGREAESFIRCHP